MTQVEIDPDQDSDPIKASYDVFIKPHIAADHQIYILQFPNRDSKQHYTARNQSQPLKMRIKPSAGMVELDVPLDAWRNYDREKGVKWGEAIKKSNTAKGGGSHGLPGGFGIGGAQSGGRGRGRVPENEQLDQEKLLEDYPLAVSRENVLTKQTLGGQAVPNDETNPQYMIGTFRKGSLDQLHLTPVDQIVQMRPQFHHIDAHSEQERFGRGRDPALATRVQEARAIHMTVKSNIDGEEETTDTMAKRISAAQTEAWKSHRYVDEEDDDAWNTYEQNLFVGTQAGVDENGDLFGKVPKLLSALDDGEYLDFISAPRDAAKLSRSKRVRRTRNQGKEKEKAIEGAESDTSSTLSSDSEGGADPVS